jgi:hypothetical protein
MSQQGEVVNALKANGLREKVKIMAVEHLLLKLSVMKLVQTHMPQMLHLAQTGQIFCNS